MNEKQREKYKEWIEKGKWNFVFRIVYCGFGIAMLMILFDKFILEYKIDSLDVFIYLIILGIGGFIAGLWIWGKMNKKIEEISK